MNGWNSLFGPKTVTKTQVEAMHALKPRRISFFYTHKGQPKRSAAPHIGAFSVPFSETIQRIFEADTGLQLRRSNDGKGVWLPIQSEADFQRVSAWVQRQGTRFFLRDCLDLSVALDQNFVDTDLVRTELGGLEARAKGSPDEDAITRLVGHYVAAIRDLPGYGEARYL